MMQCYKVAKVTLNEYLKNRKRRFCLRSKCYEVSDYILDDAS